MLISQKKQWVHFKDNPFLLCGFLLSHPPSGFPAAHLRQEAQKGQSSSILDHCPEFIERNFAIVILVNLFEQVLPGQIIFRIMALQAVLIFKYLRNLIGGNEPISVQIQFLEGLLQHLLSRKLLAADECGQKLIIVYHSVLVLVNHLHNLI